MVNGHQLTMLWHVDSLKISQQETLVVINCNNWLNTKYISLTIHRGKVHDYVELDSDYSTPGVLTVLISKCLIVIIHNFPESITIHAATLTPDHFLGMQKQ